MTEVTCPKCLKNIPKKEFEQHVYKEHKEIAYVGDKNG